VSSFFIFTLSIAARKTELYEFAASSPLVSNY